MRHRRLSLPAVLFAANLAAGCALIRPELQSPTVRLIEVELLEASFLEQRLLVTIEVDNPNDVALPLGGLAYRLTLASRPFGEGRTGRAVEIPARGSARLQLPVTTDVLGAADNLLTLYRRGSRAVEYEVAGSVDVDLPFYPDLPFRESGRVELEF
jgi:LEA14-like dessication related protein